VVGCAWIGVAAESPRTEGSKYAKKTLEQKEEMWSKLSRDDRGKAEKLKKEIQLRIQPN